MKKSLSLLLTLALLCVLLVGCGAKTGSSDHTSEPDGCKVDFLDGIDSISQTDSCAAMRCRIVAANGSGFLVASVDSEHPDIYDLSTDGVELLMRQSDGTTVSSAVANLTAPSVGAMVEVCFNGDIMETYPARFGGVQSITVLPDEFDDRCALYLSILEELWGSDSGLNADIASVSVDLSATSLTPAERSAVAWVFAQSHGGVEELEYSYAELLENGYITGTEQGDDFCPRWEGGVLFTLAEEEDATFFLPMNAKSAVSLSAEKWRSALGAYGFRVTAMQDADGAWHTDETRETWIS